MRQLDHNPQDYQAVQIALASPDIIRSWSHGEVKTSETINYRTYKPERDGLFCGKIFGPIKDYECICGKYKRMKHRGITCEKCGVEVIEARVRRERLGHITLSCPVSHIWFLKGIPSKLANFMDISVKDLERIIYFDAYLVIDAASSDLKVGTILEEQEYQLKLDAYPDLVAKMGAEAIKELMETRGDLTVLDQDLREQLKETSSETKRKKLIKRLKVIDALRKSGLAPTNMILEVLPVISPELRPIVPLEGGRFAASDLNDLYRRVIHRNNRLKRLLELNAPDIIVKNEKRMLQESVDALFDNGRRGKAILGKNKRPLKSLSDSLKGKYGRFRQNLLGKRVDYSGRTVIVVGPDLKLNQCGLPKQMALELFKPFIFQDLIRKEKVPTIKVAKKLLENKGPEIWASLDTIIDEHPVLLNRAPTLHRLGIQAFEPLLIEGKSIQLHPLVCSAFNADFDGDQMAIHVPLTTEAQLEAKVLMMATNNILSPATGRPILLPTQDMVLGIYWITKSFPDRKGQNKVFADPRDAVLAYEQDLIDLQAIIKVRIGETLEETTAGRMILRDILPLTINFPFINRLLKKKDLEELIDMVYRTAGTKETVRVLDEIKKIGFKFATDAGFSISMNDMVIPPEKKTILDRAYKEVNDISEQHNEGVITSGERYNKVIDIWSKATEEIAQKMIASLAQEVINEKGQKVLNPIFAMADSGARGSTNQSKQLGGMRGLMAKPSGEIIESPITANFREGLTVHQYFISTHGARKGLADTALKTARSGYLTRKLVDVAQDCIISMHDCGTELYAEISDLIESGELVEKMGARVLGRVTARDILHPASKEVLIPKGTLLDEGKVKLLEELNLESVKIRNVLFCEAPKGLCATCYGRDLARGEMVSLGEAVGVIAAQSIGEPGTQLTMRTFHIGGTVSSQVEETAWIASKNATLSLKRMRIVTNRNDQKIAVSRNTEAQLIDSNGSIVSRYNIPAGAVLFFQDGDKIKIGEKLAEWDPFSSPIISDMAGKVQFLDILEGKSVKNQVDEATNRMRETILEATDFDLKPRIVVLDPTTGKPHLRTDGKEHQGFYLPARAELLVHEGQEIMAGDLLAKIPRESTKNKDITGGLPRIIELFEAREPKDSDRCQIAEISGYIEFGTNMKRKRRVLIHTEDGTETREYLIPKEKHIIVMEGDYIQAGEKITEGLTNPHDILKVKGLAALVSFLVKEIQEVYRLQGVKINDKQIEIIIRQMLTKVEVTAAGDSTYLMGDVVSRKEIEKINLNLTAQGLAPAEFRPKLLGITKAALSTDSFLSAASFQETTKVLTEASLEGRVDHFEGLKENVIIGRLVPAGTGFFHNKHYGYETVEKQAIPAKVS